MDKIIYFNNDEILRKKCIFINKPITYVDESGNTSTFPCIVLCDKESNIPLSYTKLENWLVDYNEVVILAESTINKRAFNVCSFLNYILWNESKVKSLTDVDLSMIRKFMVSYKTKADGSSRKRDTWEVCCKNVFKFLINYYNFYKSHYIFKFTDKDLSTSEIITNNKGYRKIVIKRYSKLNVKPPRKNKKKNRILLDEHLNLLLLEAKKHYPDLVLAIALSAYAGLREGEIVNLTLNSIKEII